jgi:hypothetical protein
MTTKINFKTVEEFIGAKFENLTNSTTLMTSMSEKTTIAGKNAIVVLANTKGVSGMVAKITGKRSVNVTSENLGRCATVLVVTESSNYISPTKKEVEKKPTEKSLWGDVFEYDAPWDWHQ